MTSTRLYSIAWLAVLAAIAFSLVSLRARVHVESRNKATELAVEFEPVEALAAAQNLRMDDAIERLKAAGVTAIILSEQTVGELIDAGKLQLKESNGDGEVTLFGQDTSIARVAKGLQVRFHLPAQDGDRLPSMLVLAQSARLIRSISVGPDPRQVDLARVHGLRIVARADNPSGSDAATVRAAVAWMSESGASVFLPQGDQVLGRKDNLKVLVEELRDRGMLYASPEFAKLGGDLNVVQLAPELVVRLHAAQTAELDKLSLAEAVERYARAASERSIRMLLLRPINPSGERPLDDFATFAEKVASRLEHEGLAVGPAKPFLDSNPPAWVFPAIGVSAAIGAIYAAALFIANPAALGLFSVLFLALGLGAAAPGARPFTALMAAMAFPLAAYGLLEALKHRIVLVHYLMMIVVSLAGGLAVAGLLNSLPYFVRAEQFEGVKLAHFGPILLAGWFLSARLLDWKKGLSSPITWLQAFLAFVFLAGLALMFLRTGNENPSAVSGVELRIRSLLDLILPARPRTKEFLFGYPALVVGLGLLMMVRKGRDDLRGWAVLALMVGAIALTSVVNTMCHLHTPLVVGVVRIVVGLVLGGIIGAGAWAVLRLFFLRTRTAA